ncbi:MAG TPA: Smr/MutS family protein [Kofleriaceae bacterium]|nr:Smr/MutS family protein [Kofleriaceae bacterium]
MKGKPSGPRAGRAAVSPEDAALFAAAASGAVPLPGRDRVAVPPPPRSPVRVDELPPEVTLAAEADGARYAARAPGVSRAQIAELRAGKLRAERTLDLHGATTEQASAQLRQFLLDARREARRCVLIVHGRGLHSDDGRATLREAVVGELLGPLSGLVHAFATASPSDGGDGATFVMLRGAR